MIKNWYAIYTKPRSEKKVNELLLETGIITYLPLKQVRKRWSDRIKLVEKPLFPSYIFIKISDKEYELVRRVYGVVNFVYYQHKPAKIRDKEINVIKKFLKKTDHSTIDFVPSDEVIILEGVLCGKKGKIVKVAKNKVLLHIEGLGNTLKAEIKKTVLQKVS